MRSRLSGLRRQVNRLEEKIGRPGDPKHWFFMLPEGGDAPDCIKVQMREHDTWFVRWIGKDYWDGLCGDDALGSCVVMLLRRGNFIVDMTSGTWRSVKK
jgi:hypothetical protein